MRRQCNQLALRANSGTLCIEQESSRSTSGRARPQRDQRLPRNHHHHMFGPRAGNIIRSVFGYEVPRLLFSDELSFEEKKRLVSEGAIVQLGTTRVGTVSDHGARASHGVSSSWSGQIYFIVCIIFINFRAKRDRENAGRALIRLRTVMNWGPRYAKYFSLNETSVRQSRTYV